MAATFKDFYREPSKPHQCMPPTPPPEPPPSPPPAFPNSVILDDISPTGVILDDVQNPGSCLHEANHSPAAESPASHPAAAQTTEVEAIPSTTGLPTPTPTYNCNLQLYLPSTQHISPVSPAKAPHRADRPQSRSLAHPELKPPDAPPSPPAPAQSATIRCP